MNLPQHIIDQTLILHRDGVSIPKIAFMMNLSEEAVQDIINSSTALNPTQDSPAPVKSGEHLE